MICLECLSSPDPDSLGIIEWFKDSVSIGRHKDNDLIIEDSELATSHLTLAMSDGKLLAKAPINQIFFVNGKKFKGEKLVKIGDKVKIGNTILRITDFKVLKKEDPKEKLKTLSPEDLENTIETIECLEKEIAGLDS